MNKELMLEAFTIVDLDRNAVARQRDAAITERDRMYGILADWVDGRAVGDRQMVRSAFRRARRATGRAGPS